MGGKPKTSTPADKRLAANKPKTASTPMPKGMPKTMPKTSRRRGY